MQIFRHLNDIKNIDANALTIGNFDGIHLAHQEILKKTTEKAAKNRLKPAILTFYPHPIKFFKPNLAQNFLITSLAQKIAFFKQFSLDYLFILPFNEKFADISAAKFVEFLENINVKELTIGHDFTFGKNRQGDLNMLKNANFNTESVSVFKKNEQIISSTAIRKAIQSGTIKSANQMLGKNFSINGTVKPGQKLANKIGFPTINIAKKPHQITPKFGVYQSSTFLPHLGKKFASITNFGVKPTFDGDREPLFETHIFDFQGNIYDQKAIIELESFIRNEQKFASIEALKQQITQDIAQIR